MQYMHTFTRLRYHALRSDIIALYTIILSREIFLAGLFVNETIANVNSHAFMSLKVVFTPHADPLVHRGRKVQRDQWHDREKAPP